jgi:hypothetical protein
MQTISRPANTQRWRDVYAAALFESDNAKLAERIADAEGALLLRAQELSHVAGDHIEEEEALDSL